MVDVIQSCSAQLGDPQKQHSSDGGDGRKFQGDSKIAVVLIAASIFDKYCTNNNNVFCSILWADCGICTTVFFPWYRINRSIFGHTELIRFTSNWSCGLAPIQFTAVTAQRGTGFSGRIAYSWCSWCSWCRSGTGCIGCVVGIAEVRIAALYDR